jgi:hypothetical protein
LFIPVFSNVSFHLQLPAAGGFRDLFSSFGAPPVNRDILARRGHSRRPGGFDAGGSLVCRETLIWSAGEKELAWHHQGVFPPDGSSVTKEFIFIEARRALDRLPKVSLPKRDRIRFWICAALRKGLHITGLYGNYFWQPV